MNGIQLRGVRKAFGGTTVLRGVSLDVAAGEFLALVGPSGCGKSTLLRIVAGIESADEGLLTVGGRDVTRARGADRDVAMVFQSYALYPHLTAEENIAVPLAMRRLRGLQRWPFVGRFVPGARAVRDGIARDVRAAAQALALVPYLARRPGQLSGGQRQRVALARAIVRQPKAFLLDEPLSNLDASLRTETRREIVAIHRRTGAATIYVTHDQEEALSMADRVAVMRDGEILQVGTPEAIYADPVDLRVATFIGSPRINEFAGEADGEGVVRIGGFAIGVRVPAPGPVTVCVRPEDLRCGGLGPRAVVRGVEFLGDSILAHLAAVPDGAPLVMRLAPEERAMLGEGEAALSFPVARALLFDGGGRRMAARAMAGALV